jgi:hypothetical protein
VEEAFLHLIYGLNSHREPCSHNKELNMADEAPSPVDEEKDKLLYGAFKESETSSRRKYVYTTLQEDEIRLVTLLPQSAGLPIFCNMSHVSLESEPIYEALSYTWGAREALTTISFNDRTMVVRRNLWMALSHLRHLTEPRVLWIDAICIDQSNNDERRSQVSKMFKIYEQASMVAVVIALLKAWRLLPSLRAIGDLARTYLRRTRSTQQRYSLCARELIGKDSGLYKNCRLRRELSYIVGLKSWPGLLLGGLLARSIFGNSLMSGWTYVPLIQSRPHLPVSWFDESAPLLRL